MTLVVHTISILCKLDMGYFFPKNRPVLHCLGLWLQQQQCSNRSALELAESIVTKYIELVPDAKDSLNNMPNISAVFAVHFMTCLTELYCTKGNNKNYDHYW